ncbi:HIT family protein [Streptomyces sp. NPDC001502]|uniref:HIT family protein n=1 Tax=Streptomyces sp. NPDC001502 TaxID=3364578 RepID=UPI00367505D0
MTEPSEYVSRLPVGEPIPFDSDGVALWETFPFDGELGVRPLEPPVLPEPPRNGEDGPEGCEVCVLPDSAFLWTDEHWRLRGIHSALPAIVQLVPRVHRDLTDLPPERAAELGPLLQRTERAVRELGGIARVHVAKYGDGAAHLHLFQFARPEGMLQLRGSNLPLWDDVLPRIPDEVWAGSARTIAAAMAKDGGTAHV